MDHSSFLTARDGYSTPHDDSGARPFPVGGRSVTRSSTLRKIMKKMGAPATRADARLLTTISRCKLADAVAAMHERGASEFRRVRAREEGRDGRERRMKGRKRDGKEAALVTSPRERTTRPGALCDDRKRVTAIYKMRRHRNWASSRRTERRPVVERAVVVGKTREKRESGVFDRNIACAIVFSTLAV